MRGAWLLLAMVSGGASASALSAPAETFSSTGTSSAPDAAPLARRRVALIGGPDSEAPGAHDHAQGVRAIASLLAAERALDVVSYPDGWPTDPGRVDALVWYFDGHDRHPLRDPARRAAFDALVRQGVGVVALHQASTVPEDNDLGLAPILGGVRRGLFDRSTEWTTLEPQPHAVTRGLVPFAYRDEFYPTFAHGGRRIPLLRATLHPQYRGGMSLVEAPGEVVDVAWAHERADGGRAVVFSGAHFQASFEQPALQAFLRHAIAWTAKASPARGADHIGFHADPARSGWHADQPALTHAAVSSPGFAQAWQSAPFAHHAGHPPRLYASPLFVPGLRIEGGPQRGERHDAVIAASSNGEVAAINATPRGDVAAGRALWRRTLGPPCLLQPAPLDGVATGILSTPVIDRAARRLYVTHCHPQARWQAWALDLGTGAVLPGWPVTLDEETLNARNRNPGPERVPPRRKFDFRVQRGALALSPDGARLYVVFGESETGWIASVDTRAARVADAFAAVAMPHRGSGGIWGAGGPAIDDDGHVYVVTGSGFEGHRDAAGDWAQSVLKLRPDLSLAGTWSPFNHCVTARNDIDLGSGGAVLVPGGMRRWLALGGKQGNVYLLDADALPGPLDRRAACSDDAASDRSFLPPGPQPQFGTRGPLSVFGPYSEQDAALDLARARSVPASFRDAAGRAFLFVTGNTKDGPGSARSVPPSLAKLRIVEGAAPHLAVERVNPRLVFGNPGSPVVTSNGSQDAIVWVLDENARRSALLAGDDAPRPVLYALDAATLGMLWRSAPGELFSSGKYNTPGFGRGQVFVGTDRVQAFSVVAAGSVRPDLERPPAAAGRPPATGPRVAQDTPAQGIYAVRCAQCHDHPQGNVPSRARLAALPRERIVEALTHGGMKPMAAGLTDRQIASLAEFLR